MHGGSMSIHHLADHRTPQRNTSAWNKHQIMSHTPLIISTSLTSRALFRITSHAPFRLLIKVMSEQLSYENSYEENSYSVEEGLLSSEVDREESRRPDISLVRDGGCEETRLVAYYSLVLPFLGALCSGRSEISLELQK